VFECEKAAMRCWRSRYWRRQQLPDRAHFVADRGNRSQAPSIVKRPHQSQHLPDHIAATSPAKTDAVVAAGSFVSSAWGAVRTLRGLCLGSGRGTTGRKRPRDCPDFVGRGHGAVGEARQARRGLRGPSRPS